MSRSASSEPRGLNTEPIDIRIVRDPIAFFAEEHLRQRNICADIDRLAHQDPLDLELAKSILAHTRDEMPMHVLDEEDDLFPLLRRRAEADDDVEATLSKLGVDHQMAQACADRMIKILEQTITTPKKLTDDEVQKLTEYAAHERRHLIVENAIILPLARARLTESDRLTLALRMAARRGICLLEGGPNAG